MRAARVKARVVAKAPGVFCGAPVAAEVFRRAAKGASVRPLVREGARVRPGQAVLAVSGPAGVLSAERVALNFLQRLSGVATLTRRYADALRGTGVSVYDTRKTTPGWRVLEKYAVRCGGGANHRMGLFDAVMIKDNHWAMIRDRLPATRVRLAAFRKRHPGVEVAMEADTLSDVRRALDLGADTILLDNMPLPLLRKAVALIRLAHSPSRPLARSVRIEISGGVTLQNIRALARLKPDRISVGRITHSAPALDLSLELDG